MAKIFVTGGAGYCGSRLVGQLLSKGHTVVVYDIMFFTDNHLPKENMNLTVIKGDIRDQTLLEKSSKGCEIFISLACISNDASFELDEDLSKSVNFDAFEPMVKIAKNNGFKRFIYASSSSVYGVSDEKNVREDHPLVPLTLYNKFKGLCEPILNKYGDEDFTVVTFRPATVCGYSERLRLDLSVNILTNHAINKKKITVFGGEQLRPNLHIQDYCDAVELLLNTKKELINKEVFNVGYQNFSINEIALMVQKVVLEEFENIKELPIIKTQSDDKRSYHINSDKIYEILNFKPKFSIEDAIRDLCRAFKDKKIKNSFENDIYFNVKRLKNLEVK
ncbi:SDR family oxidoreductase [Pelagibacteraceae bacterium]|nr:SDR family oxidoreductase [Pelagibacteraceae bacterium]